MAMTANKPTIILKFTISIVWLTKSYKLLPSHKVFVGTVCDILRATSLKHYGPTTCILYKIQVVGP